MVYSDLTSRVKRATDTLTLNRESDNDSTSDLISSLSMPMSSFVCLSSVLTPSVPFINEPFHCIGPIILFQREHMRP